MHPDSASLASAATTIEDLTARVTDVADRMRGGTYESVALDLYEVERALRAAHRRLTGVVKLLR